jgi:ribonuclease HI
VARNLALARTPGLRQSPRVTDRTEIHTDGTFNDQTGVGGWAAVVARTSSGRQEGTSSYEMELRALVEAVKLADGPCAIVSDHEGIIGLAQAGRTPRMYQPLWKELYAATAGKDVVFVWQRRDQALGSRLAHQLARDAAKGR